MNCPVRPSNKSLTAIVIPPLLTTAKSVPSLLQSHPIHLAMRRHFLIVAFPIQGHITPARNLACRLSRISGALVTVSTPISAHRRMFPNQNDHDDDDDRRISYSPYSDGFDTGFDPKAHSWDHYLSTCELTGTRDVTRLAHSLAARGRPVTCVVYTILLTWAGVVARDLGVPSAALWVQPASVLAICHHYFHGHSDLVSAHRNYPSFTIKLPGLPSLQIRDLPCYLYRPDVDLYAAVCAGLEAMFRFLDRERPSTVLINSFESLEPEAISAVGGDLRLIPIGLLVDDADEPGPGPALFADDKRSNYMAWLDSKEDSSVVYVSFGSQAVLTGRQEEEILKGLEECGRPYLWVVRGEKRVGAGEMGMVVEWCHQVRVLSHRSMGCFVTHCGWNSTAEGMACGVPAVALPQGTEQATNARLVEGEWGNGVRAEVDAEGVMAAAELRRCLDLVMGDGERGASIRRRAREWRERARKAVMEGGSSDRNLRAFVGGLCSNHSPPATLQT